VRREPRGAGRMNSTLCYITAVPSKYSDGGIAVAAREENVA
jgi:hypothetical protein